MLGDYIDVEHQLDRMKIPNIDIGDLILNMYTKRYDTKWFFKEKKNIS